MQKRDPKSGLQAPDELWAMLLQTVGRARKYAE